MKKETWSEREAAQAELDEEHAQNPVVGDMWFERMFVGILLVLAVGEQWVTVTKTKVDVDKDHYRFDEAAAETWSRDDFIRFLKYQSKEFGDKFWCNVRPAKCVEGKS